MYKSIILGCLILTWYFNERSQLITNGYHCWQDPSFKPLLSKFEPNSFISLQVAVSERHQLPNILQRRKKVNFVYGMVQKWLTEFRCTRTNTETIPSPGRPIGITTPEMINKIHDFVLNDPKVKVREISEIVSMLTERVVNILHTHLYMRKLCARWALWLFTIDQKRIRVTTSEQNLAYFNQIWVSCFYIWEKEIWREISGKKHNLHCTFYVSPFLEWNL